MTSANGRGLTGDRGSAVVEFLVVAVGLLVPVAYLAACAGAVESAAYATSQAVREAGRAFVTAGGATEGRVRAVAAARLAFADQGLLLPDGALRLTCVEGTCLEPGSAVVVDLSWAVPLPWLPAGLADAAPATLPVTATHRVPVDEFRADPDDA